ncbi:major capsid protein [Streptodolium elevatio]|uniref:Major capsid protein n=1 Tax=Streptodolium elevatio TaxID=3157996 RepID=A0ABV3DLF1_9ACTN
MFLNTEFITPAELTGYSREALRDLEINRLTLSQYLPSVQVDDLMYRFSRGGGSLLEAAPYQAYDAEASIAGREGVMRVTGELPPIKRKIRLGEYERLRQRHATNSDMTDALMTDAETITRQIAVRVEKARADALVTGQVVINENEMQATVNFGRTNSHSVTAGTAWSNPAATIITDLLAWRRTYINTNGERPGVILTSELVLSYMLLNAEIRTLASSLAGTPSIVSEDTLGAVLRVYGLPPVRTYDAQYKSGGVATRFIPEDKLLYLPSDPSELGGTFWGTTVEALDGGYSLESGEEAGIVSGVYRVEESPALWTKAAAIVLPVLANPDLTFVADVIP